MRIMLLSLAGAVSALAVASPAAAQWAPQPYGYGSPGYGYGQPGYGYGAAASLQTRVAQVRRQIFMLSREQRLSPGQSRHLFNEARQLDERVRRASFGGINPYEMQELQARLARLEQRVRYAESYGNRYGYGAYGNSYGSNGYNGYYGRGDREADDHDRWGGDRDDDGD